jgi:mannose-6-phosphate isomerase-like protein (cupin superfamily)
MASSLENYISVRRLTLHGMSASTRTGCPGRYISMRDHLATGLPWYPWMEVSVPTLIAAPARITASGNLPKIIDEYIGRVNSGTAQVSVAHMRSPGGWEEPGQTPEFDEFTVVLRGMLRVESRDGDLQVRPGQAVIARAGEWVRYSTPEPEGAEYIAVCLPAFAPDTVHRDA